MFTAVLNQSKGKLLVILEQDYELPSDPAILVKQEHMKMSVDGSSFL